jgi:hypothetical protein
MGELRGGRASSDRRDGRPSLCTNGAEWASQAADQSPGGSPACELEPTRDDEVEPVALVDQCNRDVLASRTVAPARSAARRTAVRARPASRSARTRSRHRRALRERGRPRDARERPSSRSPQLRRIRRLCGARRPAPAPLGCRPCARNRGRSGQMRRTFIAASSSTCTRSSIAKSLTSTHAASNSTRGKCGLPIAPRPPSRDHSRMRHVLTRRGYHWAASPARFERRTLPCRAMASEAFAIWWDMTRAMVLR